MSNFEGDRYYCKSQISINELILMMFRYSNQNKSDLPPIQYFFDKILSISSHYFPCKKSCSVFSRKSLQMHKIILTLYEDMHLLGFALSLLRRKVFVEKLIFVVVKCFEKN